MLVEFNRRAGYLAGRCAARSQRSSRRAGTGNREVVKQTHDAGVEEGVIRVRLAPDVVAVFLRCPMEMLVAISAS